MQSNKKSTDNIKYISMVALFTAFAVILSYVETFIPIIPIQGVKLGLANFAVVLVMYLMGYRAAITLNIVRIVIIGAFFGNLFSICFSMAGALVSFGAMALAKKSGKISMVTVAILGGVFHNVGQIIVASFVVNNYGIMIYIPILIVSGIITGMVIGILASIIYRRVKDDFVYFRHD